MLKPNPAQPCLKTCCQTGSQGPTGIPVTSCEDAAELRRSDFICQFKSRHRLLLKSGSGMKDTSNPGQITETYNSLNGEGGAERGYGSLRYICIEAFRFQPERFWNVLTENALRSLLEALTSPPYAPMQHLEREQALAKQFAEILHFTLSFDELKVKSSVFQ